MRYIVSFIWAILISAAIAYVLTSMGGEAFSMADSLILAVIISIVVYLLGDGLLREEK